MVNRKLKKKLKRCDSSESWETESYTLSKVPSAAEEKTNNFSRITKKMKEADDEIFSMIQEEMEENINESQEITFKNKPNPAKLNNNDSKNKKGNSRNSAKFQTIINQRVKIKMMILNLKHLNLLIY